MTKKSWQKFSQTLEFAFKGLQSVTDVNKIFPSFIMERLNDHNYNWRLHYLVDILHLFQRAELLASLCLDDILNCSRNKLFSNKIFSNKFFLQARVL